MNVNVAMWPCVNMRLVGLALGSHTQMSNLGGDHLCSICKYYTTSMRMCTQACKHDAQRPPNHRPKNVKAMWRSHTYRAASQQAWGWRGGLWPVSVPVLRRTEQHAAREPT